MVRCVERAREDRVRRQRGSVPTSTYSRSSSRRARSPPAFASSDPSSAVASPRARPRVSPSRAAARRARAHPSDGSARLARAAAASRVALASPLRRRPRVQTSSIAGGSITRPPSRLSRSSLLLVVVAPCADERAAARRAGTVYRRERQRDAQPVAPRSFSARSGSDRRRVAGRQSRHERSALESYWPAAAARRIVHSLRSRGSLRDDLFAVRRR